MMVLLGGDRTGRGSSLRMVTLCNSIEGNLIVDNVDYRHLNCGFVVVKPRDASGLPSACHVAPETDIEY
jgi:hypothetical protein